MNRWIRLANIVALVCCVGCDSSSKPTPKSTPEPKTPTSPVKQTTPPEVEPVLEPTKKKARPKATARIKSMSKHLLAGQKAVRAKKYDDGLAAYQEAFKLDPNHPMVLGEMGWVYFKKKDLEQAESYTLKALAVSSKGNQLGMFLYNMGRISEARGNKTRALRYYLDSLEQRYNKIVQKKITALMDAGVVYDGRQCAFVAKPVAKEPRVLCRLTDEDRKASCSLDHKTKDNGWLAIGKSSRMMLISAQSVPMTNHYAIIEHNQKTYYTKLASTSSGMGAVEDWVIKKVDVKPLNKDGQPEVAIYANIERSERESFASDNWRESMDEMLIVLSVDGEAPEYIMSMILNDVQVAFLPQDGKVKLAVDAKANTAYKTGTYTYKEMTSCPATY